MSRRKLLAGWSIAFTSLASPSASAQGTIKVQIPRGTNLFNEHEFAIVDGVGYINLWRPQLGRARLYSFSLTSGALLDPDGLSVRGDQPVRASNARLVMGVSPPAVVVVDISESDDLKLVGAIPLPCGDALSEKGICMAPDGHTGFLPTLNGSLPALHGCVNSFDIDTMSLLDPDGVTLPGPPRLSGLGDGMLALVESAGAHVYGVDVSDPSNLQLAWTLNLPGVGFSEVEISDDRQTAFVQTLQGVVYSIDLATGTLLDPDGLDLSGPGNSWLDHHGDVLACGVGPVLCFIDTSDPSSLQLLSTSPQQFVGQQSNWGGSAFSPNGSLFAAASFILPEQLSAIDSATGAVVGTPVGVGAYPSFVATFGTDDRVAVLCTGEDAIRLIYGLLGRDLPTAWCTPKVNSQGCSPKVSSSGTPSASSAQPFLVTASDVINHKVGTLLYGPNPTATPYLGGVLCLAAPQSPTPAQGSGGNPPPTNDCSGAFSIDFNAWIQSGADPQLVPGAVVFSQYWYRDPDSQGAVGLSDSLQFVIHP
jgi:hypothetical protein